MLCESGVDQHINGLTMRESMQYRNQKMSLELAHRQLDARHSRIEMSLIRPPAVKTQSFSPPDSISAKDYVRNVLSEQGML
jgi:hypothetical protein